MRVWQKAWTCPIFHACSENPARWMHFLHKPMPTLEIGAHLFCQRVPPPCGLSLIEGHKGRFKMFAIDWFINLGIMSITDLYTKVNDCHSDSIAQTTLAPQPHLEQDVGQVCRGSSVCIFVHCLQRLVYMLGLIFL
jgi:hypothetical protein